MRGWLSNAAQSALSKRQSDLAAVTSSLADSQKQRDQKQKDVSDRAATISSLDAQRSDAERQLEKLKSDRDQLTRDLARKDTLDKELQDLNAKVAAASTTLDQVSRSLASKQGELAADNFKDDQRANLGVSIDVLTKKRDALRIEVYELQEQSDLLRKAGGLMFPPQPPPYPIRTPDATPSQH